jgi:hypothetical protein
MTQLKRERIILLVYFFGISVLAVTVIKLIGG